MTKEFESGTGMLFARHPDPIVLVNEKGSLMEVNEAFVNHYLENSKDFRRMKIQEVFQWDKWDSVFTRGDKPSVYEWIKQGPDKDKLFLKLTVIPSGEISTDHTYFIVISDVTDQKQIEQEFQHISATLQMIETNSSDFITVLDINGIVKYASASYSKIFGRSHTEILDHHAFEFVHPDDIPFLQDRLKESFAGYIYWLPIEFRYLHQDGHWVYTDARATPIETKDGISQITLFARDISHRKKLDNLIHHMAYHDSLTGLPNRLFLREQLGQMLERKEKTNSVSVLFIDLDGFKNVNDTLGHSSGDLLLKEMGNRLNQLLPPNGFLARMGGDEFIILLDQSKNPQETQIMADRVLQLFESSFFIEETEIYLTASIGISMYPQNGDSVEELIRTSDIALYKAKNAGKNRYMLFD